MGDWCQRAVNHLTKEEMGNKLCLSSYSNITAGTLDKDRALSLDASRCVYMRAHEFGFLLRVCVVRPLR